jgi:hypothetical protein
MKTNVMLTIRSYRVLIATICFFIDWGMIALIDQGKSHSEPVYALLCFLGGMWFILLLAIALAVDLDLTDMHNK